VSDTPSLPPTPERRALARRAGIVPLSPALTAAAAVTAGAAVLAWAGGAVAGRIAAVARAGVAGAAGGGGIAGALPAALAEVVSLAAPLVAAIAAVAGLVHLGQTRTPWLPRRRLRGAPRPRGGAGRRAADAAIGLLAVAVGGALAGRFVLVHAADLVRAGAPQALALVAIGLVQVAAGLLAVAVVDAGLRMVRHAADLRMTPRERRDEERARAGDPRWRRLRRERAAAGSLAAVAGSAVVVADETAAVAIAWHARFSPVPRIAVAGTGRAALAVVAAARRHGVPIQRDGELAAALAGMAPGAAVASAFHPRLARHLAAVTPPERR
jgi:flagellar biosynthesis protein FlhB